MIVGRMALIHRFVDSATYHAQNVEIAEIAETSETSGIAEYA